MIGLALSIFCREIIVILATPKFHNSYKVVPIIVVTYIFNGMYYMAVNGIFYTKKTLLLPVITSGSAFLNILFNVLLIPRYEMMGAAFSNLISFFTVFLFTWVLSMKIYPIRYEYGRILRLLLAASALFTFSLFITPPHIWQAVILKLLLIILYPILLWVARFFYKEELITIGRVLFRKT